MWRKNREKLRESLGAERETVPPISENICTFAQFFCAGYSVRMLVVYLLLTPIIFSYGLWLPTSGKDLEWQKPGCYKVGHTRKVEIGGCVSFHVTTNACRGFCESWAVPSDPRNTQIIQPITSTASCCNIMETEPIRVNVVCDSGLRTFVFKSAVTCSCYHCKKD